MFVTAIPAGRRSIAAAPSASTMFAARLGSKGGFGVPSDIVRDALSHIRGRGFDRRLRELTV